MTGADPDGELDDPFTDGLDGPLYIPRCSRCGLPLAVGDPDAATCRCRADGRT